MHGLTGGSWKRDTDRATAAEKNDPRETGRSAAPRLPPILVTAPAPDPPSDVLGVVLSASGAGGGDT